jgi:hypothetical protein
MVLGFSFLMGLMKVGVSVAQRASEANFEF